MLVLDAILQQLKRTVDVRDDRFLRLLGIFLQEYVCLLLPEVLPEATRCSASWR